MFCFVTTCTFANVYISLSRYRIDKSTTKLWMKLNVSKSMSFSMTFIKFIGATNCYNVICSHKMSQNIAFFEMFDCMYGSICKPSKQASLLNYVPYPTCSLGLLSLCPTCCRAVRAFYMLLCLTCLALDVLYVLHVLRPLCALVSHVSRALHVLMPHVLCTLRILCPVRPRGSRFLSPFCLTYS